MTDTVSYREAKNKQAEAKRKAEGTPKQQPKNQGRYARYANAGLDIEGKGRAQMGANDENPGYSDSDTPEQKAKRAEIARQATVRGMHGKDRTPQEIKESIDIAAAYLGGVRVTGTEE